MSSKPKKNRTKQYLTLLIVAGLIAIVGGASSGTFASFSAEVTNTGNYFATGTLVLNDNGGTTTCTSAGATTNLNNVTTNGCDTLFTVGPLKSATATLTTALSTGSATTALAFTGGLQGGAIDAGDTLTLDDGAGHTDTLVASAGADVGAGSVTVTSKTVNFAFPTTTTTVSDATPANYAKLTLTNAGTLAASGIKFDIPTTCATTANEGVSAGLTVALTSGVNVTSLTFQALTVGGYAIGDPIVVTEGTNVQTFIASSAAALGATTVNVTSQKANFSYTTSATVAGPVFPTAGDLCAGLKLSVIETDASFNHSAGTAAKGCAYGTTATGDALTAGLGCNLGSGTALSSVPGSLTSLSLFSGGGTGNTAAQLSASGIRYFLIAVKETASSFDNTYQNRKAKFDLRWHLDQA